MSSRDTSPNSSNPAAKLPCFVVPHTQNDRFFGRGATLDEMFATLAPLNTNDAQEHRVGLGSATLILSGLGGIGKTQTAVEFVHRHRKDYNAILWVTADSAEKLAQAFINFAQELKLVDGRPSAMNDRTLTRDLVLGWLALPRYNAKGHEHHGPSEATWLLVFDNVDDPELLDGYWPRSSVGSVLITSRGPLTELYYTNPYRLPLQPFNTEETVTLLLELTSRDRDAEKAADLNTVAEITGGFPLAIFPFARLIAKQHLTFAEFARNYRNHSTHPNLFQRHLGAAEAHGYPYTLASALLLENLEHSRYFLEVISFLDPDKIPEYIVDASGRQFDTDMAGFPHTSGEYQTARAELLNCSLVSRDRDSETLGIHRLTQDAVRAAMDDERYSTVFTSALQLLHSSWPYKEFSFWNETDRWQRCDELYPHLQRMMKLMGRLDPPRKITSAHIKPPQVVLEAAW